MLSFPAVVGSSDKGSLPGSPTFLQDGIEAFEFDTRFPGAKAPVHRDLLCVAFCFPGSDLLPERLFLSDPPIQALSVQDGQFDLGHIQPTPVLRGVDIQHLFQSFRQRRHWLQEEYTTARAATA